MGFLVQSITDAEVSHALYGHNYVFATAMDLRPAPVHPDKFIG